jgi:hypothetical protein
MSQGRPEKGTDHEEARVGIAFPQYVNTYSTVLVAPDGV